MLFAPIRLRCVSIELIDNITAKVKFAYPVNTTYAPERAAVEFTCCIGVALDEFRVGDMFLLDLKPETPISD